MTPPDAPINERIRRNIESIARMEQAFERRRTAVDRVSDAVSAFGGSIRFIAGNAALIAGWVLWNLLAPPALRFDPAFGALQLLIAGEALFLSAFVLMTQNRQNRQADHWAHVGLQISLLAEQESTKALQMMESISRFLGMEKTAGDKELKQLTEQVPVAKLVEEVGKSLQPEDAAMREIAAVLEEESRAEEGKATPPTPGPTPP
jgi:uncharacterized membrane protein